MSVLRQVAATAASAGSADLGRRIDDLIDAVRAARPITVNALPENAVETARATQLALRIA